MEEKIQTKYKIHQFILQSDLIQLKHYLDLLQISILDFDEPSLLLMAIEVYLDPKCLLNQEYQLEMIIFLSKIGLRLLIPGGLQLIEQYWGVTQPAVIQLLDYLLSDPIYRDQLIKQYHFITDNTEGIYLYLNQYRAALIIQRFWKKHKMELWKK